MKPVSLRHILLCCESYWVIGEEYFLNENNLFKFLFLLRTNDIHFASYQLLSFFYVQTNQTLLYLSYFWTFFSCAEIFELLCRTEYSMCMFWGCWNLWVVSGEIIQSYCEFYSISKYKIFIYIYTPHTRWNTHSNLNTKCIRTKSSKTWRQIWTHCE